MALALAARIAGDDCAQAIQPASSTIRAAVLGGVPKAPPHIVEGLRARMRARLAETGATA
jgi:hypothetical protein